ncbi:hypothetical protein GH714_028892 [Hevea brasiliensis]|uniref:Uncharacterized protein n=1 Tax=Hevea brasiliensis TaxID=3981 RepID=A0A6A6M528_HEVBR|nr:hypothetical protein GH714_028892 [Hevea brasiliensis]
MHHHHRGGLVVSGGELLVGVVSDEQQLINDPSKSTTMSGPAQYTQWLSQLQLTKAGPNDTAGFIDAPSNAPPAKIFAPTMKPIAMGAIIPKLPFFGSMAVAYTVYTSPKVITISKTNAFHTPTPEESAKPAVATGTELEKQASDCGAEELSDPVEDSTKKSDVAADEGAKCNSRVDMTTGNVGANGNSNKKCKSVRDGCSNETSRGGCTVVCELAKGHTGTFSGEHEIRVEMNSARAAFKASG